MKTDTPRTDKAEREYDDGGRCVVYSDFARELERENVRLREAIKTFCDGQEWADKSWKEQSHIKPLFAIFREMADVLDAYEGKKHCVGNQGQPLDGYSALANFVSIAEKARSVEFLELIPNEINDQREKASRRIEELERENARLRERMECHALILRDEGDIHTYEAIMKDLSNVQAQPSPTTTKEK